MIHTDIRYVGLEDWGLKYGIQNRNQRSTLVAASCGWMALARSSLSACPLVVPGV